MKKNIYKFKNPLGLLILFLFSNFCYSQSDIIISQYIETSSGTTPKGLEIFNISGSDIDFSVTNLQIYQGSNGAACAALGGTLINSGILAADEVWVIGTTDLTAYAVTNGTDLSGNTTFAFGFNGDDALQLYLGGVLQDEFGTCGSDPGSRWTGSGATIETANDNIQIKDAICDGDTDGWTDPSVRFDHVAIGTDMTGFGNAPASCAAASPTILASPSTLTGFTYVEGAGPTAEQSFDVSGSDLTADISVTPPTNWEIATVSGGPYQTTAITLSESGGTVSTTTIYARMVTGLLNVNSPFSGNIINASTGATSQNVAVDGTVTLSGGCSEIFISEYIEGSASNKFIELYNPTASPILLTGTYDIEIYTNGAGTPSSTIALVGTIGAYDVFVLENSAESLSVTADQSSGSLGFNGDDAVALTNSSTIIDVVGEIGLDPGTEWTGSTCTQGTADGTIVRNSSIDEGDNNGGDTFDPDIEWTCYNVDDVSNLGSHTSTCSGCTHTVDSFTPTSGAVGSTVTITGTGFTGSSTVTFNGTSASVTFVNTTTLTVTVPVGTTTGVITVTESGCDVDSATDYTVTACTPTHTISSFTPTSGPELTIVTITGTGFSGSSTVDFNGTGATIISQTATQLVVEAPTGSTTGVITVTESGCPVDSSTDFTILTDNDCTGSTLTIVYLSPPSLEVALFTTVTPSSSMKP